MCNVAVLEFFIEYAQPEEFRGGRVLEVGSRYVNGSVRPLIESSRPGSTLVLILSLEGSLMLFARPSYLLLW